MDTEEQFTAIKINARQFIEQVHANINSIKYNNWIFDDINCYRVTIHKTEEGNLTTAPINGILSTLNINSGQLFVKVIHTSKWNGKRRLGETAKEMAGEELAALIRALPLDMQPRNIFTTRHNIVPFIKKQLIDYPEIQLQACDFILPLQALIRFEKIGEFVMSSTEPRIVLFNLYEDWQIEPAAAFRRLILILRALRYDIDAKDIINPEREKYEGLWPNLSKEEWMQKEIQLKNLIVQRWKINHSFTQSLTEQQIEEIIYSDETEVNPN